MAYGEPTSQSELTEAKSYGRSRISMKRAEERRSAGDHTASLAPRPTVATQQCGDSEKLQMVRDVVKSWNDCTWVTDRDALVAIMSIVEGRA